MVYVYCTSLIVITRTMVSMIMKIIAVRVSMMMAVRMRTMSTRGGGKDANDEDKGDGGGER